MTDKPFKKNSRAYLDGGFKPLPVRGKFPPVVGATGHDGVVNGEKVEAWRDTHPEHNIGLRAEGWIGIDVDVYKDKHGDRTLAAYIERLGPLPKTWSSTARGKKTPSRQYLFRVPEGVKLATKLGNDIEIIQFRHRYTMVYPSIHPDLQKPYYWYLPNGEKADRLPTLDELPDLPDAWLDDLSAAPDSVLLDTDVIEWRELVKTYPPSPACHVTEAYREKIDATNTASHIGHDEALRLSLEGFMLGREGHAGIGDALLLLEDHFTAYLKQARPREAKHELESVFASQSSIAQRKPIEDKCSCFTTTALTIIDPGLKKREAKLPPLTRDKGGALYTRNARERFMAEHPVKRYRGSLGATYIWLGDRWKIENLSVICYRWLSARIDNEMTKAKAEELANSVLAYAEEIDDDSIDQRYISVANGLLNWETGELVERTRDIFVVNHLPLAWRPSATLGKFATWMETAIDAEMMPHVWEIIGYTVAPVRDLKVALAFSGMGGGGKSTLINVLQALVGPENATHIPPSALGDRFNRSQFHGKMLNSAGDVGAETIRNVGPLKSIIASDVISAEYKGKDGFSYRPNVFIVASFNTLPASESNDSGFWDRWLVLSFKQRFNAPGEVEDNYWRDQMPKDQAIMEGVLVEAVSALRRLRARGQFDKAAFAPAKNEWRQEVDSVAAFAHDRLILDPDGEVKAKAMHELYSQIETSNGGHPRKNQTFYRELIAYFNEQVPGQVTRGNANGNVGVIRGVKIIHSAEDGGPFVLSDPSARYGVQGWTSHPHLKAVGK